MRDENNSFKDKIDQIKSHESPLDIKFEWDALDKRMNRNKKRRIMLWFWPLFMAGIVGASYFWNSLETSNVPNEKINIESNIVNTSIGNLKGLEPAISSVIDENNNISNQNTQSLFANKTAQTKSHSKQTIESIFKSNSSSSEKGNTNQNSLTSTESPLTNKEQSQVHQESESNYLQVNIEQPDSETGLINVAEIDQIEIQAFTPKNNVFPMAILPYPTAQPKYWLDFRNTIGIQQWSYNLNDQESKDILSARQKGENALETYATQLGIGRNLPKGFYVTTSLLYQNSNEKWTSNFVDTLSKTKDNQVIEIYTNQSGATTEKLGTKSVNEIVNVAQTRFNTIQNLSAVIGLGKYIQFNKMRLAIEANISMPLIFKYSGETLVQNNIMKPMSEVYTSQRPIQLGISTSYLYPVSGNLAIYGGYDYKYSKLETSLGYSRKQKFHSVAIGMRYFIKN